MSWYYAKNDQQLGPINDAEFETLIQQGVVTPETVVWQEGMADWKPLREVRGDGASPLASGTCALCGKSFPPGALITLQGRAICPECKPLALQQIMEGVTPTVLATDRVGPAWEQRKTLGFFKAIWQTFIAVVSDPGKTFSTMKREGGIGSPWLFYLILSCFGFLLGIIYQLMMTAFHFSLVPGQKEDIYTMLFHSTGLLIGLLCLLIAVPLLVTFSSFIWSGVLHLCLKILGGANQPFETTYRVIAYTAALSLFGIIPIVGGVVGGIWMIIVVIIGLAKAHEISIGKSVGAVLLPLGACCVFYICIIVFAIALPAFDAAHRHAIQQSHHSGQTTHLAQPISR